MSRDGPLLPTFIRRRPGLSALGLLLVIAILGHAGVTWYAGRQLRAMRENLRREGKPVTVSELVPEPLADDQNAWLLFQQAGLAMNTRAAPSPRNSVNEYHRYPPRGARWEADAAKAMSANASALKLARQARALNGARVPAAWRGGPAPHLNGARYLGSLLADAAEYSQLQGDSADAVERLLDGWHLAEALRSDPEVLSALVADGLEALICEAAHVTVPEMQIADGRPRAASSAQLRALVTALLDESAIRAQLVRTVEIERATKLDFCDEMAGKHLALRPLAQMTAIRAIRDFEVNVRIATVDNAWDADSLLNGYRWSDEDDPKALRRAPEPRATRYSRWFEYYPNKLSRLFGIHFHILADRRLCATMVALNWYRHDHGAFPASLSQLVPNYLPAVPIDPMRNDGREIQLLTVKNGIAPGTDRVLVFVEQMDFGGQAALSPEPMVGLERWAAREYRDVSLWVPAVRSFNETAEEQRRHDREEEEADRNAARTGRGNARTSTPPDIDQEPEHPETPGNDAKADESPNGPAKD